MFENSLTQENFEDLKGHAKVFERVKSPRDYPKFMKNRGFSEGEPSPQDVAFFADETAPMLRRISEGDLDYEVWKAESIAQVKLAFEEVRPSTMEAMQDSFSIYDVLWAFSASRLPFELAVVQSAVTTNYNEYA